jgi:hypothetical protein
VNDSRTRKPIVASFINHHSREGADPMKVKTNMKAGEHCHNALNDLLRDPRDGNKQRKFCDCCARDPYCLY